MPFGALLVLRRRLALDTVLLEKRVEVGVCESPTILGDERGSI